MRKYMAVLIKLLETLALSYSLHTQQQYLDAIFVRSSTNCGPK